MVKIEGSESFHTRGKMTSSRKISAFLKFFIFAKNKIVRKVKKLLQFESGRRPKILPPPRIRLKLYWSFLLQNQSYAVFKKQIIYELMIDRRTITQSYSHHPLSQIPSILNSLTHSAFTITSLINPSIISKFLTLNLQYLSLFFLLNFSSKIPFEYVGFRILIFSVN